MQLVSRGVVHLAARNFVFATFTKKRWIGRKLLDVLCAEFSDHDREYYVCAARTARILVIRRRTIVFFAAAEALAPEVKRREGPADRSFVPVRADIEQFQMMDSDILLHLLHRHEPPIVSNPRVHSFGAYLVCEKPGSVPTHPCGKYCYHSVSEFISANLDTVAKDLSGAWGTAQTINICNRLDKLVSGMVLLARSQQQAGAIRDALALKTCLKLYLAHCRPVGTLLTDYVHIVYAPVGSLTKKDASGRKCYLDYLPKIYNEEELSKHISRLSASIESFACDSGCSNNKLLNDSIAASKAVELDHDRCIIRVHTGLISAMKANESCDTDCHPNSTMIALAGLLRFLLTCSSSCGFIQSAVSMFMTVAARDNGCILLLTPLTGRTHQLRLHARHCGCPLVDDPCYGTGTLEDVNVIPCMPDTETYSLLAAHDPPSVLAYKALIIEKLKPMPAMRFCDWDQFAEAINTILGNADKEKSLLCPTCAEIRAQYRDNGSTARANGEKSTILFYDDIHGSVHVRPEYIHCFMISHISLHCYSYEFADQTIRSDVPAWCTGVSQEVIDSCSTTVRYLKTLLLSQAFNSALEQPV